jgi:hypothetical protein
MSDSRQCGGGVVEAQTVMQDGQKSDLNSLWRYQRQPLLRPVMEILGRPLGGLHVVVLRDRSVIY